SSASHVMNDAVPVFRVSSQYLKNLWLQAASAGSGILASWVLFLIVSALLLPSLPLDQLLQLPWKLASDPNLISMPTLDPVRELIRFGVGPGLAVCALLGGLGDYSSWVAVRYEIHPNKLRMYWHRLTRELAWDLITNVDERPHVESTRCSLVITQVGTDP